MSAKIPIINQISWISIIPQFILIGLIIYAWQLIGTNDPPLYGIITFLILLFSLRTFVSKNHRKGISFLKKKKYQEAINQFEISYNFFEEHKWIDDFRSITLLSSSKISYKEMALCNIAFSYGLSGNGVKAKEYYERALVEFPNSSIAQASLSLLNSMTKT